MTSEPPATSDSLLARATVRPASSAASVARRPCAPATAFRTTSASSAASSTVADGPAKICGSGVPAGQIVGDPLLELGPPGLAGDPDELDPQRGGLRGQQGEIAAAGADRPDA